MSNKIPLKENIKRVEKLYGKESFDFSAIDEELYKGTHYKYTIKCNRCGAILNKNLFSMLQGLGCPYCDGNKISTKSFIERSKKIHGENRYDYSQVEYKGDKNKVIIKCNECGKIFEQRPSSHLSGNGCPDCALNYRVEELRLTLEEFIEKAKKVHGNLYSYDKVIYINNQTKIKIKCNRCGKYFLQRPSDHLCGYGCRDCNDTRRSTKEEFIEKAEKIHGKGRYNYFNSNYINTHTHINIECNICHRVFSQTPHSHLGGSGCPYCRESHGERDISILLKSKNINFISQHRFNDCRDKYPLPFDFYLPDYNTCIEFDGEQHFIAMGYQGGEKNLKYTQKHDSIKNEYCKQNNIPLLRIKYTENIETKLNNFLLDKCKIEPQSIFDL